MHKVLISRYTFKTATISFCLNTTKTNLKSCKKLFFTALASVVFASTGFAKGSETLVNENLNVVTESLIITEESSEDTFYCYITVTVTNADGFVTDSKTYVREFTSTTQSLNQDLCNMAGSMLVSQISNHISDDGKLPIMFK